MNNPQQFPSNTPEFHSLNPGQPSYNQVPQNSNPSIAQGEGERTFLKERLTQIAVYPHNPLGKEKSRQTWIDIALAFGIFFACFGFIVAFTDSTSASDFMGNFILATALIIPPTWWLTTRIYNRRVIKKWQEVEQQRRRILANLLPEESGIADYLQPEPLPMVYRKHNGLVIALFLALCILASFFFS